MSRTRRPFTRIRGIRSPTQSGHLLGRSDAGEGPVHLIQADGVTIKLSQRKLKAIFSALSGDITATEDGVVTVVGLEHIPLDLSSLTNNYVLTYDAASGKLKLKVGGGGGGVVNFTDLADVPASYAGAGGEFVKVNAGATGLEFVSGGSDTDTFVGLTDGPGAFTGQTGKSVRVNAGETALEYFTPSGGGSSDQDHPLFTTPTNGSYSWVNQGGATVTVNANGGIALYHPHTGTTNLRARVLNAPATPYTLTAAIYPGIFTVDYHEVGLCFRESGTGKIITLDCFASVSSGQLIHVGRWNSATSFNTDSLLLGKQWAMGLIWLRINNDGTNLNYSVSFDGYTFIPVFSEGKTGFFTTGPDQIGFHTINTNATFDCANTLMSWAVT